MSERGSGGNVGLKALVEYKKPGEPWRFLPGPSTIRDPGLDRDVDEQSNFAGASQAVGDQRLGEIVIESRYMPQHQSWKDQRAAFDANSILQYRYTLPTSLIWAPSGNGTVAIESDDGVCTFAGDAGQNPDFREKQYDVGMALEVGADIYIIDDINAAGQVIVNPRPNMDVAASAYKLRQASLLRTFGARVKSVDRVNAEGMRGSTRNSCCCRPRRRLK